MLREAWRAVVRSPYDLLGEGAAEVGVEEPCLAKRVLEALEEGVKELVGVALLVGEQLAAVEVAEGLTWVRVRVRVRKNASGGSWLFEVAGGPTEVERQQRGLVTVPQPREQPL